uniref:Uncharacterized protein n=1 Tax=Medicago truncatula TaxID=3880 RepID=I3SWI1_MEDTR|nr:unknown [Medicago truncatula]
MSFPILHVMFEDCVLLLTHLQDDNHEKYTDKQAIHQISTIHNTLKLEDQLLQKVYS